MMRKIIVTLVAAIIGGAVAYAGSSNTNYTSAGTVGFRTTTDGTTNCVGTTACNLANVTIWDSTAGANGLAVNASGQIGISNFPAAQNVNPATTQNWGLTSFGTNQGAPFNMLATAAQYNLTPPSGTTSGNMMVLQADVNGNLKMNCVTGCAGSGGTSSNFGSAFPTPGTAAGAEYLSTPPTYVSGNMVALQTTINGSLHTTVDNATTPGSATPTTSSPVVNAQTTPVLLNAITNTSKTIKASAGQLVMLQCGNTNTSEIYVQIYNNAAPTVGTTTPTLSIPIAASSTGGFALPGGIQFATAITAAATTTATGGTAPSTALDCNASYM